MPDTLAFPVLRAFWLTGVAAGQWSGRHVHRESILATFLNIGRCALELYDGQ